MNKKTIIILVSILLLGGIIAYVKPLIPILFTNNTSTGNTPISIALKDLPKEFPFPSDVTMVKDFTDTAEPGYYGFKYQKVSFSFDTKDSLSDTVVNYESTFKNAGWFASSFPTHEALDSFGKASVDATKDTSILKLNVKKINNITHVEVKYSIQLSENQASKK